MCLFMIKYAIDMIAAKIKFFVHIEVKQKTPIAPSRAVAVKSLYSRPSRIGDSGMRKMIRLKNRNSIQYIFRLSNRRNTSLQSLLSL